MKIKYKHFKASNGDDMWVITNGELIGKLHRLKGPAYISRNYKLSYWYYKGEEIICDNQKEFDRIIKLRVFE